MADFNATISQNLGLLSQAVSATFKNRTAVIAQDFSGPSYTTTGKAIEGKSPLYESYDKAEMWSGGNTDKFTFAAFLRIPEAATYGDHLIFSNGGFYFTLKNWFDSLSTHNAFNLTAQNYATFKGDTTITASKSTHGIGVGDWFALLYSIDYSGAAPVKQIFVQKKGSSTAYDILAGATYQYSSTGPVTFDYDSTGYGASVASHPFYGSQAANIDEAEFYMTNEYVDWSDPAERAKFISADGYPVGLGPTGAQLTGTQAKVYAPDGDLENNVGSGGNWTEVGTISDSATNPSNPSPSAGFITQAVTVDNIWGIIDQNISFLSQSVLGNHDYREVSIDHSVSLLSQDMQGLFNGHSGPIAQTIPILTQAVTADYSPGFFTGAIAQPVDLLTQAVSAEFFAGTSKGPIAQAFPIPAQAVAATNGPGIKTGVLAQVFSAPTQAVTGTFLKNSYSTIEQNLAFLTQACTATWVPGTKTGAISQSLSAPSQAMVGSYAPGTSRMEIFRQALPWITQAVSATVWKKATVSMTLPVVTQSMTASFAPGTSTASIDQNIALLNQSVSGTAANTVDIAQTLDLMSQAVSATYAPGGRTASIAHAINFVAQVITATYEAGTATATISQPLALLSQNASAVTYVLAETESFVWVQPETQQLVWSAPPEQLIWVQKETQPVYLRTHKLLTTENTLLREDDTAMLREDGTSMLRESTIPAGIAPLEPRVYVRS